MSRTLEELDREVTALRGELEQLKRREAALTHPIRRSAGWFSGDEQLTAILEEIERERKPALGLAED